MANAVSTAAHLLWTGGWDSTFRLLDLLLVKKRPVQPYYLIDSDRLSTGIELRTIKRLRSALYERDPDTRLLLAPLVLKEINDIAPNPALTSAFYRLRVQYGIGKQYEWLSRYCEEAAVPPLEMSVARLDGLVYRVLEPLLSPVEEDGDRYFAVNPAAAGTDAFEVFKYFRFPLFELTKVDMERLSRERGFDQLLEMSWFCHFPRPNGTPCGLCPPCTCVMEEGMGRRIPPFGRMRYQSRRVLRKLKRLLAPQPA